MPPKVMTTAQANLELSLLSAEAEATSSSDLYAWLRESGLPGEAAIRLKKLVDITVDAGGRLVSIGKILLLKLIEFVKAHPNLAVGIALGAAIGALVSMIPFLGTFLWPVATVLGVSLCAVVGHQEDKLKNGQTSKEESSLITITQDVIEIARAFFQLLIDVVTTVLDERTFKAI